MQSHSATPLGCRNRAAIEARLAELGFRVEHSLSALEENEGHAVVEISTGELVDPPAGEVLELATAWSLMEGACAAT